MHWRIVLVIGLTSSVGLLGAVAACTSFGADSTPDPASDASDDHVGVVVPETGGNPPPSLNVDATPGRQCAGGRKAGEPTCGAMPCDFKTGLVCCLNDDTATTTSDAGSGGGGGGSSGTSGINRSPTCGLSAVCSPASSQQTCAGPDDCPGNAPYCCAMQTSSTSCSAACAPLMTVCAKDGDCPPDKTCLAPKSGDPGVNYWHCGACP